MKKTKIFLTFILAFTLGVLTAVGAYFYVVGEGVIGDVDLYEYIKTEVIPNAILALSSISALCVAAIPIIKRVELALSGFDKATKDVNDTVLSDREMLKKADEQKAELERIKGTVLSAVDEIRTLKEEILGSIAVAEKHVENIEEIVHIGFEEDAELVKRGIAAKIAKVGVEDDGREEAEN